MANQQKLSRGVGSSAAGSRRLKKGVNLSRKQVYAAQREVWTKKEKLRKVEQQEEKRQKVERIQKLKNKKTHRVFDRAVLRAVQDGLVSAIELLGQRVSPLALFMSASTTLSKAPDQHHVPYMLSIMSACTPQLSQGVLLHQMNACFGLCDQLIAENNGANLLVSAKAFRLATTLLLSIEVPNVSLLTMYQRLEPSKLNTEAMKLYLTGYRKVLEFNALSTNGATTAMPQKEAGEQHYRLNERQKFFCAGVPLFVGRCLQNLAEAPAAIITATLSELSTLFDRTLSPYIVESQEGRQMIDGLLSDELLSLLKPVYQQCWGMAMEVLATLFARLNYLKRVAPPPVSSLMATDAASAAAVQGRHLLFTERFPSVPFLMKVLNKLRVMDDSTLNSKVDRAFVAIGNCMSVKEFSMFLSFDPQAAHAAESALDDEATERATMLWSTSYVLPILRRIASHDSLAVFVELFFPQINFCSKMAAEAERSQRPEEYSRWTALLVQLWRVGVGFCHYPVEVTNDAFRDFAKQLVGLLSTPTFVDIGSSALHVLCDGYYTLSQVEEQDDDDVENEDEGDDAALVAEKRAEKLEDDERESAIRRRKPAHLTKDSLDEDVYFLSLNDPGWNPHRYHNISQSYAKWVCENVFAKYSANIMPKLCNTFESHNSTAVLLAIQSFSKVCTPAVMTTILKGILNVGSVISSQAAAASAKTPNSSMVTAGNTPLTSKRRMILDIACVVVSQLPSEHVLTLFEQIIEPVLMDPAPESRLLQKKAYKLLFSMFENRMKDIFPLLQRVLGLLSVGRQHVTISGMKMRIRCLSWALDACKMFYPDELLSTIRLMVAEIVLFSRERSSETRTMTMEVLEKMHRYMIAAGAPNNALLHMVLAGLSGKTPMMVSSAVVCMAKMVYLTHTTLAETDLQSAVAVGFHLMESAMMEVRAAAAIFARMALKLAKRSPAMSAAVEKSLTKLLYAIALITSQPHVSSNTRVQMRVLLEKCIKRFSYEKIDPIFPLGSKNFLRYTQKMMRREEKKAEQELKKRKERHQSEFDKLFLGASLDAGREDAAEEDLLQAGALTSFVTKHAAPVFQGFGSSGAGVFGRDDGGDDEYDDMLVDVQEDGKLRILSREEKRIEDAQKKRQALAQSILRRHNGVMTPESINDASNHPGKRSRADAEDFENEELTLRYGSRVTDEAAQKATAAYKAGRGRGTVGPSALQVARQRDQKVVNREAKRLRVEEDIRKGDEFRGTGDGDVKRGAMEPFAYVPLNRRYMNRRHTRHAVHRFEVVAHKHLKGEKAKMARPERTK